MRSRKDVPASTSFESAFNWWGARLSATPHSHHAINAPIFVRSVRVFAEVRNSEIPQKGHYVVDARWLVDLVSTVCILAPLSLHTDGS